MRLKTFTILVIVGLFQFGCASLKPVVLNDLAISTYLPPESALKDTKGRHPDNGVIMNFAKGSLSGWWGNSGGKFGFQLQDSTLMVSVNDAGANYESFGCSFSPIDMSNAPVIRIIAKSEGETQPELRLDLKDADGLVTNALPVIKVISNDGFKEYIYDFSYKFNQSWPSPAEVNSGMISDLMFFVNPGGTPFNGKLIINKIELVETESSEKPAFVIEGFDGRDMSTIWPCDEGKQILTNVSGALRVDVKDASWQCFGKYLGQNDISEFPVLRLKMKAIGNSGKVDIAPNFIDQNGVNSDYEQLTADVLIGTEDYQYYYYDFTGKLLSLEGDFDAAAVDNIMFFINTKGRAPFTGSIFIDEIAVLDKIPDYVKNKKPAVRLLQIKEEWPKGNDYKKILPALTLNKEESNSKLQTKKSEGKLTIEFNEAGKAWERLVFDLKAINMQENSLLTLKANASEDIRFRIDLVDNFGTHSNGIPQEKLIEAKDDVKTYQFDFSDNFIQRNPNYKQLNMANIQKVVVYINGGLENRSGSIDILELSASKIE